MDVNLLLISMVLGSIGMGYMVYGKKQERGVAFLSGILLCVMPYFGLSILLLILCGVALIALPFMFRV